MGSGWRKSSHFSQLSDAEKEDILRRASRLSRVQGSTLTEISRRIARRLGRSPETIRYTLKNFDRAHPEKALFPETTGPLDAQTKQLIYSSFRRGIIRGYTRQAIPAQPEFGLPRHQRSPRPTASGATARIYLPSLV